MSKIQFVILMLTCLLGAGFVSHSQENYNNCNQAFELCPNEIVNLTNIGANKTLCSNCEDDFNFCFIANNTIWIKFTTNAVGGNVQLAFTNLVFENQTGQDKELQATLLEASIPCDAASYSAIGNCVSNGNTNFNLNASGLLANTTYYGVISGDNIGVGVSIAAECTFDLLLSGTAVDRSNSGIFLSTASQNVCKDDIITFSASLNNCPDSLNYSWFVNGELVANTLEPYFSTTLLNDSDKITVSNSCYSNCPVSVISNELEMQVKETFVDAGVDVHIVPGQSAQLNGQTLGSSFYWSPATNLSSPFLLSTVAKPTETTTYHLVVTEEGCTTIDEVTIFVDQGVIIPSNFSPNGDGLNDVFEIKGLENHPDCIIKVYDRWGQMLYHTIAYNYNKSWDGTFNGKPCLTGTYYYYISLGDSEETNFKGSITLVR